MKIERVILTKDRRVLNQDGVDVTDIVKPKIKQPIQKSLFNWKNLVGWAPTISTNNYSYTADFKNMAYHTYSSSTSNNFVMYVGSTA